MLDGWLPLWMTVWPSQPAAALDPGSPTTPPARGGSILKKTPQKFAPAPGAAPVRPVGARGWGGAGGAETLRPGCQVASVRPPPGQHHRRAARQPAGAVPYGESESEEEDGYGSEGSYGSEEEDGYTAKEIAEYALKTLGLDQTRAVEPFCRVSFCPYSASPYKRERVR